LNGASTLAARWSDHLQHDRRRSAHTVRAYVATAHRLVQFLGEHWGGEVDVARLHQLTAADLRAFLARRRMEGLGAASAARELSGVRAFLKYAAEQQGHHGALPRTRAPKRPRTLPRPTTRWSLRRTPRMPPARRGSGRGTLPFCCCSTELACASLKPCP
jgi:integrase/recombinase XerC